MVGKDGLVLDKTVVGCFNGSPLHVAAIRKQLDNVKELLQSNPELAEILDSGHRSALHFASAKGYLDIVKELIKVSPEMCLARDHDGRNPLHIAVMKGDVNVVEELVQANTQAAEVLDLEYRSALHLASAKEDVDIVKALIKASPEMCLAQDRDGRIPLHIAVIKGKVKVIEELVRANSYTTRVMVDRGETILHLCVKYNQLDSLKLILQETGEEFVNAKESGGNTILHLAVSANQLETIEYLLQQTGVDANAKNANGFTALDISAQNQRVLKDSDIEELLRKHRALTATKTPLTGIGNGDVKPSGTSFAANGQSTPSPTKGNNFQMPEVSHDQTAPSPMKGSILQMPLALADDQTTPLPTPVTPGGNSENNLTHSKQPNRDRDRDALMVMASLIATMAFQAGLNPPGGVWQDNLTVDPQGNLVAAPHRAGEAIIAYTYPNSYKYFLRSNTIGFVASLSVMSLLISRLPYDHKNVKRILLVILWLSITAMAFTYAFSTVVVTPRKNREQLSHTMYVAVPVWCGVMTILLLAHIIKLTIPKRLRKRLRGLCLFRRFSNSVDANQANGSKDGQIQLTPTHADV